MSSDVVQQTPDESGIEQYHDDKSGINDQPAGAPSRPASQPEQEPTQGANKKDKIGRQGKGNADKKKGGQTIATTGKKTEHKTTKDKPPATPAQIEKFHERTLKRFSEAVPRNVQPKPKGGWDGFWTTYSGKQLKCKIMGYNSTGSRVLITFENKNGKTRWKNVPGKYVNNSQKIDKGLWDNIVHGVQDATGVGKKGFDAKSQLRQENPFMID